MSVVYQSMLLNHQLGGTLVLFCFCTSAPLPRTLQRPDAVDVAKCVDTPVCASACLCVLLRHCLLYCAHLTSSLPKSLPVLAHERATSPLFQASAFAFRSFPLLLRLPLAFAPSGNKRLHHQVTILRRERLVHSCAIERIWGKDVV